MSHNPLSQVQKAKTNLQTIFPNIKGVLIFIGELNPVELCEVVQKIQIVQRHELMELVWEMKQEERNYMGYGSDKKTVSNKLAPYKIVNPYQNKPIPKELLEEIRPGFAVADAQMLL